MLTVKARNLEGFMAKLRKHKLLVQGQIASTKRRLVTDVFTDLVKGSPQWSGNLASNWTIEFHGRQGSYNQIPGYKEQGWANDEPYKVGDDPAVSSTLARELAKIADIRWNSKVQLVNYAPYASEVEAGTGPNGRPIREENYKYGQIAMAAYVVTKYSSLRTLKRRV